MKIKTNYAYVDEDGVFVPTGREVEVSESWLKAQNELADRFNLIRHEVLEEGRKADKPAKPTKPADKPTKPTNAESDEEL